MDLLANELSVHEQFEDLAGFRDALSCLMALRQAAGRFGCEVLCPRTLLTTKPIRGMSMQQAIGNLGARSQRRAVMAWLGKAGPFWDDLRQHGEDDWLEFGGDLVTDTAVGEAAFRTLHGAECGLISFSPSRWERTPVGVTWCREAIEDRSAKVANCWNDATLESALRDNAPPLRSWADLRKASTSRFARLRFAEDCFAPLGGVPFARNSAGRLLVLLDILERLSGAFDESGARTEEGHRLYRDHFTGDRALFSDSSDFEKREFRRELTFAHPEERANSLFCPWHGKVPHQTLRLHFSWPVRAGRPVHVVYAGPKITKR